MAVKRDAGSRAESAPGGAGEERILEIERLFDAPRDVVFDAWTQREHIMQWMAPRGFTIPLSEGDVREGGKWRMSMQRDEGPEMHLRGVYTEVVRPERLVFTHAWLDENGNPGHETVVTVTFTEHGTKTKMLFQQSVFKSTEDRDAHRGGWTECFDRLAELLAQ